MVGDGRDRPVSRAHVSSAPRLHHRRSHAVSVSYLLPVSLRCHTREHTDAEPSPPHSQPRHVVGDHLPDWRPDGPPALRNTRAGCQRARSRPRLGTRRPGHRPRRRKDHAGGLRPALAGNAAVPAEHAGDVRQPRAQPHRADAGPATDGRAPPQRHQCLRRRAHAQAARDRHRRDHLPNTGWR